MVVRIQDTPFSPGAELDQFTANQTAAGAVVSFTGIVRDEGGRLSALEIEHYPAMTAPAIEQMVSDATDRFGLSGALVIHRFGTLSVGEEIMMVATAAPHRASAFQAADYLMDYLKSRAPFWKKEHGDGGTSWVEAKDSDEASLARW